MSVVLNLFVALMLPGIIVRTRALLAGRKGAPFYQHISRLGALLCKAPVYSPATGFVFRLAPVVYLASTVAAMLLVPVGDFSAVLAFNGDIVLFCYLLALGRVMLILAAMETGSSIAGMGDTALKLKNLPRFFFVCPVNYLKRVYINQRTIDRYLTKV